MQMEMQFLVDSFLQTINGLIWTRKLLQHSPSKVPVTSSVGQVTTEVKTGQGFFKPLFSS
jgi:hypothetical protein